LVQEKRINSEHHVTLIHFKELKINPSDHKMELWKQYEGICKDQPSIRSTNKIMHITIRTMDDSIKNFHANTSNALCESALTGSYSKSKIWVINLENELVIEGTVRGCFR